MISKLSVIVETLVFKRSTNLETIFSPLYSGETIDMCGVELLIVCKHTDTKEAQTICSLLIFGS
ncbi:MAG: hypothetical protein IJS73_03625 [Paludibacteraceae bacterium]|nr:hypothetical protein [Paludibacteraceae bacterium]